MSSSLTWNTKNSSMGRVSRLDAMAGKVKAMVADNSESNDSILEAQKLACCL